MRELKECFLTDEIVDKVPEPEPEPEPDPEPNPGDPDD